MATACELSVAALCAINLAFAFADKPEAIVAQDNPNLPLTFCVAQTVRAALPMPFVNAVYAERMLIALNSMRVVTAEMHERVSCVRSGALLTLIVVRLLP
jgi:hypothetical protein